uniref:Immunoglobulin subtype domain-containing protein n=1 Tax=Astatotilapia calliptera TaxID=8154 RepID=A0A3P8NNC5_ASTCA
LEFQYVFVRHGKDLHLDIGRSVVLDKKTDLIWKFNKTNNVAKCAFNNDPVVFDKYEGRAELFRQNYSLLLKNVQHSDSGDYTALMVSNVDQKVTCFKSLHVCSSSDPVSPVHLTVDSVSGSSESCVLAVTCSTVDSSIHHSFRCDDKNCSQVKEKPTNYSSSFIVYRHQDFILCNHSNQVSWEYNKIKFDCKAITGKYKSNDDMNDKSTLIYYSAHCIGSKAYYQLSILGDVHLCNEKGCGLMTSTPYIRCG